MYQERESYVERLSKKRGYPLKIHACGYDAYLVGEQPLNDGRACPIYRFPGGTCCVHKDEWKRPRVCPVCENEDNEPWARYCKICGKEL